MKSGRMLSLLNEGRRSGMLQSRHIHDIQAKLMLVLRDLIRLHAGEDSSSIAKETAENLLVSILYSVDAELHSYPEPSQAIHALQTKDVRELYERGKVRIQRCLEETKRLYQQLKNNKLDLDVDAYHVTIDESLPLFLKKYEMVFDAHNTMASIDYPLAIDDMRVQGVFYMRNYVEHLLIETRFCRLFERDGLLALLRDFGLLCQFDYRIELFNIFELVMNQAVFSVLSGGSARQIAISQERFERLQQRLVRMDVQAMAAAVHQAAECVLREWNIDDDAVADYVRRCTAPLITRLRHAAEHNSLHAVIVTRQRTKEVPIELSFRLEDRWSDVELRKLLANLAACDGSQAKARLLHSRLRSLHDYLDVLDSDTLYGDEYEALFELFGDVELAVLAKIVFYEELRGRTTDISTMIAEAEKDKDEDAWESQYIVFMKRLNKVRLAAVEQWMGKIEYEEMRLN